MRWTTYTANSGYREWVLQVPQIGGLVEEWHRHKGSDSLGKGLSRSNDAKLPNSEFVYKTNGTGQLFSTPEEAMKWQETNVRCLIRDLKSILDNDTGLVIQS